MRSMITESHELTSEWGTNSGTQDTKLTVIGNFAVGGYPAVRSATGDGSTRAESAAPMPALR